MLTYMQRVAEMPLKVKKTQLPVDYYLIMSIYI